MSHWTHIFGSIRVYPWGRTKYEKEYILKTILDHLPIVGGSERNMRVTIIPGVAKGSSSTNEFGERSRLRGGKKQVCAVSHWIDTNTEYTIVVEGDLRDKILEETKREFYKWLIRLSKRIIVEKVLVQIDGENSSIIVKGSYEFSNICEDFSRYGNGETAWAEYLMWEPDEESGYPKKLLEKYKH